MIYESWVSIYWTSRTLRPCPDHRVTYYLFINIARDKYNIIVFINIARNPLSDIFSPFVFINIARLSFIFSPRDLWAVHDTVRSTALIS